MAATTKPRRRANNSPHDENESKLTSIFSEKTRKINKRKRQSAIILVFITVLIDMLGLFLCIPILANLTREIQGEPNSCCPVKAAKCKEPTFFYPDRQPTASYYESDDPNIPSKCVKQRREANSNIGLTNTMYAAGTFMSTFWMPKVSDSWGRRPAFFLSLQGSMVGFLLFAFSANFIMLLVVRFIGGLFGGSTTIANAYITDVYEPHERGAMFGRMGATIMISVLVGPMIGGGLVTLFQSLRAPLFAASAFCFIALCFAYFYIKEPRDLYSYEDVPLGDVPLDPITTSDAQTSGLSSTIDSVDDGDDNDSLSSPAVEPNIVVSLDDTDSDMNSSDTQGVDQIDDGCDEYDKKDEDREQESKSSYNPYASVYNILIGVQTFCTGVGFSGLSALVALLLLEPRYKVVDENDSIEDQGQDMALQLGFTTMTIAAASVPTMLILFPRLVVSLGLLETGAIGSFLFGLGIFLLPFTDNITTFSLLLPVIGIANGFQMNVSTMALSENAPPSRVAATLAVKQTFDALAQTFGPFLTLLYRDGIKPPFIVAGCFCFLGALILISLAGYRSFVENRPRLSSDASLLSTGSGGHGGGGDGSSSSSQDHAWSQYSPQYLDQLEEEVRLLPPKAPHLGTPRIDASLIPVMFKGLKPGVDYDEVFANDLVHYIKTMYTAMEKQGHLQVLKYRTNVDNLNQIQQAKLAAASSPSLKDLPTSTPLMNDDKDEKKDNKEAGGDCDPVAGIDDVDLELNRNTSDSSSLPSSSDVKEINDAISFDHLKKLEEERAKELYEQVVRHRVFDIETMMLERAYPYLPPQDGSISSRLSFLQAIQILLEDLGFDLFAGEIESRLQCLTALHYP